MLVCIVRAALVRDRQAVFTSAASDPRPFRRYSPDHGAEERYHVRYSPLLIMHGLAANGSTCGGRSRRHPPRSPSERSRERRMDSRSLSLSVSPTVSGCYTREKRRSPDAGIVCRHEAAADRATASMDLPPARPARPEPSAELSARIFHQNSKPCFIEKLIACSRPKRDNACEHAREEKKGSSKTAQTCRRVAGMGVAA